MIAVPDTSLQRVRRKDPLMKLTFRTMKGGVCKCNQFPELGTFPRRQTASVEAQVAAYLKRVQVEERPKSEAKKPSERLVERHQYGDGDVMCPKCEEYSNFPLLPAYEKSGKVVVCKQGTCYTQFIMLPKRETYLV